MLWGPGISGSGQARMKQPMNLVLKAEGSAGKEAGSTCGSQPQMSCPDCSLAPVLKMALRQTRLPTQVALPRGVQYLAICFPEQVRLQEAYACLGRVSPS